MVAQEVAMEVRPDTVIVIPAEAGDTERYAASELESYIFKINGVSLSVVSDDTPEAESEILIGETNRTPEAETPELYNDGYWLHNEGDKLFIRGENERAELYGVYGLLEDVFGCRFFTSTVESIPKNPNLTVPDDLDVVKNSAFEFRDHNWYTAMGADFSAKRGFNGHCCGLEEHEGGAMHYFGNFVHTMGDYVPRSVYAEEHPEWFTTRNDSYQLCLSNPEVLDIVIRGVLENIKANPQAKIFSISQRDNYNYCCCERCAAIDEEEGSHAGTLLRFVNAVAERVAEEYPDVIIDTLAYQYTRTPPKITRPAPNVVIRFCTIEACFSHSLAECTHVSSDFSTRVGAATMQEDLAGWGEICDRIYIWDYNTNYRHYLSTFPNLYIMDDDIRYFLDNSVTGLFEEANYESIDGEFGDLKTYLMSKLMWNPDGDPQLYIREFLKGVYGDGAGPIGEYLDYICTRAQEENVHVSIYDTPSIKLFEPEYMAQAEKEFERAEVLAADKKQAKRVRRCGLQVRYINLSRMSARTEGKAELMDAFEADLKAAGITALREQQPLADSIRKLRNQ